jgi:hypothetical protein
MLREEGEFLPESFDAFSNRYLDAGGRFTTEGSVRFIQEITGYISYLNRENDIRQFAYPILTDIKVPISKSQPTARIDNQIKFYENLIDDYKTNIEEEIPEDIKYEKMIYQEKKEECLDLETKKEQKECQDKATNEYKEQREHITKQIESIKEKSKTAKKELREAKKKREQMEKEDISQETILKRDCFKQKK